MDMVRHLVDVLKLEVNAVEHKVGSQCSTPLCCVARWPYKTDPRELVDFLLDRGADPDLEGLVQGDYRWGSPITCAQNHGNSRFLQVVQEWRARKRGKTP